MLAESLSNFKFVGTLHELGDDFYDPVEPARFPQATLRYWNAPLASEFNRSDLWQNESQIKESFWSFQPAPGSLARPLALRYHGHQFRTYNPDLGDGRGFVWAQAQWQNKLWDFGTKGSGQTPYSRQGDGKLTLKGAFREALATELLQSLGVNTSRSFCFFETGEKLVRGDEPSPTRSAVLTRFSHSHIRFGTFQRLASLGQKENLRKLLMYCQKNLLPEIPETDSDLELASEFLKAVSKRWAKTTAQWMIAGFVHGVLNTDNLNVTAESFDYGPYRFLPHYDPNFTAAYFDQSGLYCYGRQPISVSWALEQLGKSLQVLVPELDFKACLDSFGDEFTDWISTLFLHRLNLRPQNPELNQDLIRAFFQFQEAETTLFEQTFFDCFRREENFDFQKSPQAKSYDSTEGLLLLKTLEKFEILSPSRAQHSSLHSHQPVTLLIDEIEAIWRPIAENDDWSLFEKKLEDIRSLRGLF